MAEVPAANCSCICGTPAIHGRRECRSNSRPCYDGGSNDASQARPMALSLHNTLTREREPFEPANPADPKLVTMYVCGPTVYNYAHIGNMRPPVVFDVLARVLRRTYTLTYARNVRSEEHTS